MENNQPKLYKLLDDLMDVAFLNWAPDKEDVDELRVRIAEAKLEYAKMKHSYNHLHANFVTAINLLTEKNER